MAPSDDDRSELLDDDVLSTQFPPDRPLGVADYGTTHQEQRIEEPIEERVERYEADAPGPDDDPVLLLDETDDALDDEAHDLDEGETGDAIQGETGDAEWAGDNTGPSLGPPSSPMASDRVPLAAEESAVHVVDGGDDVADIDDEGQ